MAADRSHGVGQRSGDEAGAAEAYLAGQVEVLPKILNHRSLLNVKPAFCVSVCVCESSLLYPPSVFCTIFHSENHAELN